jgi:exopolysaccharide production protein ExoZ
MDRALTAAEPRRGEIVGIQYLRAIAALAVVVDHAAGMAAFPKYFGQSFYEGFFSLGAIGVNLFFIISGFIIVVVSLKKDTTEPRVSIGDFAIRRFARIVPIMWVAILSYMGLRYASTGDFTLAPYLNALFLLPFGDVDPDNIWTLRHEFIFYSFFAVSFLGRRHLRWLIALWSISPLIALFIFGPVNKDTMIRDVMWMVFNPVNLNFGVGVIIGLAWLNGLNGRSIRIEVGLASILATAFVATMVVSMLLRSIVSNQVVLILFYCVVFGSMVLFSIVATAPVNRFFLFLGSASYSIYLFHPHFESALLRVWSHLMPQTPIGLVILAVSVLATGMSCIVYLYVELPLVKFAQNLLAREKSVLQTATNASRTDGPR